MRMRRVFLALACVFTCLPLAAADGASVVTSVAAAPWDAFAGMREERAGQNLELRDELIPAHLSYLESLTLALAGAEGLDTEDPLHPLAWARIEYLLETSFRLLDGTGEYDAFLKATEPLRPAPAPAESTAVYVALAKARAAWLRGLAFERTGRSADGAGETAGLGLVRDWLVLGAPDSGGDPYDQDSFGIDEVRVALAAPEAWRPFRSIDPLGRVYPGAVFPDMGRRTVFAVALVQAPEDMPAVLLFGSNAPVVVCVNSTVAGRARSAGLPDPDQEAFHVRLRKGWNAVFVRGTAESAGPADWGLALRFANPDGTPFPGNVARPDAENLGGLLAEAAAAGTGLPYVPAGAAVDDGVATLSRWLEGNPDDARAEFYLASFLVAKRMMEGPERFDREMIFRRALTDSDGDPFFTLMAARAIDSGMDGPDREENLRLVLLRRVADTGAAAALVDIGRLYLDVMRQPRRAKEYADRALSVNNMSLRAGVLEYDIAVAMGWDPAARRLLGELARRHPGAAPARLRLGRFALAEGRHRQALTEFHAVLAVEAGSREALDGAVTALGMLGQTSAAAELLVRHIERFPYDFDTRLKLAGLCRATGRDDDARQAIAGVLAISPDEPRALAARSEMDQEKPPEAAAPETFAAFRQELDLSPPPREPEGGWEYLYFQIEDRIGDGGSLDRSVSFAFRVYTRGAAKMMRHLGVRVESSFDSGAILRLDIVAPDGARQPFTPPARSARGGEELQFLLPPLPAGTTVETEIVMRGGRADFLGEYFGHVAPFAQSAPVRLSRYIFVSPRERRVFFRPVNGAPEAMVVPSPDGGSVTRVWEMSDLPAFRDEAFSPGRNALCPAVQVSSFGDWNEFARWYWRLIGAQYHAPPELRLMARTLGGGDAPPLAKLDRAASWIAANIGWRAGEYGPYAFRPVNARSILSRLSADSKDRTLLLCLLAREYGLEAWPVLSRLRSRDGGESAAIMTELPLLDHFNHSLALVRADPGGDVLMDAGNPYRPPGVMPPALSGGEGLVVMPDGADAVSVPDEGSAACEWTENAEMVVDGDGSVLWEEKISAGGLAAQILRRRFARPAGAAVTEFEEDDSAAWTAFLESLGASPSAAADTFAEGETPSSAVWEGRARLRRFAKMEEERAALTVPPLPASFAEGGDGEGGFAYPLSFGGMAAAGTRRQDLILPHGFRVSRAVTVRFPGGWRLVNPAVPFRREYPFGSLAVEYEAGAGSVFIRFEAEIPGHRVAAADYPAFREMAALAEQWVAPRLVWERQ